MKSKIELTETFRTQINKTWNLPRELAIRLMRFLIEGALGISKDHMEPSKLGKNIYWLTVPLNDEDYPTTFHIFKIAIQFNKNSTRARLLTGIYLPAPPPEPQYDDEE